MPEYDEQAETDGSEDEEEDEREHRSTLLDAKKEIRTIVNHRKREMLAEGTTGKVKLTEEDVNHMFEKFPSITQEAIGNTPTMLHGIIDLVYSEEDENIDSVTVKSLVKRLVQQATHLLCIANAEHQNPLYLAITKKRKILADYMVVSCPQEDSHRRHLADAIEDCRGNEQRKNCLHLAFEKDLKVTTLRRMVKDASISALEAVDTTGRRPMHYAVQYKFCNVDVIRAFIERDNEARGLQNQGSEYQPPQTFLDVDDRAQTSAYQEHVASVPAHEERSLKKETSDHKKESSGIGGDRGKEIWDGWDDVARGRNAVPHNKFQPDLQPILDNKSAGHPVQPNFAAFREPGNAHDWIGRPIDRDREKTNIDDEEMIERERRRELGRQMEAFSRQELGRKSGRGETSRDRQSLGHQGGRDALRIQTTFTSAGATKSSNGVAANTPRLLKRVPTMDDKNPEGMTDKRVRPTAMNTRKPRKPFDYEAAARVSKTVLRMLKLHYMRTRNIEKATSWLYKTNPQDVQIFFDYRRLPSELKEDLFEKAFQATKFDEILKFVHFTNVTVIRRQKANSKNERQRGGLGRQDMEFFFNFLYKKGVRYILKVVVEEDGQSLHSDEAIKNALDRMIVEHLDWRKVDLDPELICGISSQAEENTFDNIEAESSSKNRLRRLDLQWSGNNTVLRAWSEPEGLPMLHNLQSISIKIPESTIMYDSPKWIQDKKNEFEERLNKYSNAVISTQGTDQPSPATRYRKVSVHLEGVSSATKKPALGPIRSDSTLGRMAQLATHKVINTHEWLNCMDAFARNIKPLWTSTQDRFLKSFGVAGLGPDQEAFSRPATRTGLENEVVVALIDDGVSLLDQNFVGRVLEGKTFDYRDGSVGQSYNSAQGHGTEMARCILRVCPMAKIYPIRLKTHVSDQKKNEIDLDSAASAINAALEKEATIISMSWSIPLPKKPTPAQERFETAVRRACNRNVLMFCSSSDNGHVTNTNINYPSAVQRDRIFRIGAAHDSGLPLSYAGTDVDFIFPGVKVNINTTSARTGSSVATALAAGLAATIIYCFKISALAVKTHSQAMSYNGISLPTFTESAVRRLSQHDVMKTAFSHIGRVNDEQFIQIWDQLQPAVLGLEDPRNTDDHDSKVLCIMKLCNNLMVL